MCLDALVELIQHMWTVNISELLPSFYNHDSILIQNNFYKFMVLSGILHLGNIEFISDDVTGPCEIDSEKQGVDTSVNAAAQLLGLDVDALTRCLAFRQITASHKRRKSVFMKPCIKDECHTRRDCLAKLLYARYFTNIKAIFVCSERNLFTLLKIILLCSICLFTDLYIQNKHTEDVVQIQ
ncbi:unconventional myosin-XIX-like [Antedon mediterranea]|uniref:unconventional myosin-XIX-like n=1 Tax=Antedon mediterranea TaxID=105859 RepID=UPI003AF92DBE